MTESFDSGDKICLACAGGDAFLQTRLDDEPPIEAFDKELSDDDCINACTNCGSDAPLYPIWMIGDVLDPIYRRIVRRNAEYPSWIEPGRMTPEEVIQEILEPEDSRISSALAEYLSNEEGYAVAHDGANAMYEIESAYYSIDVPASPEYEERWERFDAGGSPAWNGQHVLRRALYERCARYLHLSQ
jgi:hypothetical protein